MSTTVTKTIAVLVGSLRTGSYARIIARNAIAMMPEGFHADIIDIGHLPLYNFDYDDPAVDDVALPESYTAFRERIARADGILFVTPENNRTIPAALKNAIDIGSKPNSAVAWKNKPAGIISHSVGRMGGYSAQKNLRLALSYFDMPLPGQPEVFLGNSPTLIGDDGTFTQDSTEKFVEDYVHRFCRLVEHNG
ncbi:NADPH-dependent FMN reductase [Corynebacterium uterequi]|uniref:Putative flavoprotein n=1 Tax=Corynebacterium uterequi TaxID=1072256 RepID=A0A0G3HEJ9_9CORY|nr:NADPH-dependent FMN reductase [Corynebacterium uterequi]AKK11130.1 putative flavoprotein [Corynebacterium uterequi]